MFLQPTNKASYCAALPRPASCGVLVSMDSACTPPLISSSSSWYISWCRCTSRLPSNACETTSTLKWVSASGPPPGLPACPACLWLSLTMLSTSGARLDSSLRCIDAPIGPACFMLPLLPLAAARDDDDAAATTSRRASMWRWDSGAGELLLLLPALVLVLLLS